MTEVTFHFNVSSPTGYACRLLRKALRRGSAVTVTGPEATLIALDRELWAFEPTEFVAHAWTADADSVPESLRAGTVWLAADPLASPHHDALVNLGESAPKGFESFRRLIEVVATGEVERAAARERWRSYARRGYAIEQHEVGE
ncbi:MAG: DNA polymerase III subunit chi [Caldimonas sp.]